MKRWLVILATMGALGAADITQDKLQQSQSDDANWLMYGKNYSGWRYSALRQINTATVKDLTPQWIFQTGTLGKVESTPLVFGGMMYATGPTNHAYGLDLATGRPVWHYAKPLPPGVSICCGQVNRGFAALGNKLFKVNLESKLVALDSKTGNLLWETEIDDIKKGYSATVAPLIVKNLVVVGIAGAEYGIRGFIDAYDADTGKRVWRFWTVPEPGEPGGDSWATGADAWKRGGGSTWVTGSFDPEMNLIYWGTGNPGPDWNGDVRPGDNLYSSSVIALDADTGRLKWHFQFTPHDVHDWDAVQVPVLVDADLRGRRRKLMYWGNRNAFFYVLDRETGEFLMAKPFVTQTWAERIDETGRPVLKPNTSPSREGALVSPGPEGGTNWYSPSYSPVTGLFYLSVWDFASKFYIGDAPFKPGTHFFGSVPVRLRDDPGSGAIKALDSSTGDVRWQYKLYSMPQTGLLSTAGNLVFGGVDEGQFFALDAESGKELWRANTGGMIAAGPISYLSKGKQLVTIA